MHIGINAQLLSMDASYRGAGVSNYSRRLLRALGQLAADENGANAHRFTAFVNTPDFTCPGVELVVSGLPLHRPPARIAWEQTALRRELGQREIDLLHGLVNVLPLTGPISGRVPGVVTVHDLSFVLMPQKLPAAKRAYLQRFSRASVEQARRVIAVSQQTADDLMHHFDTPASKIDVVHNGVGDEFSPGAESANIEFRRRKELPERFLLYLGTLEPRKNLPLLIKAYAQWDGRNDVGLVLAGGKGWFYDETFALVRELGVADQVHFPGFVPAAELPDWYRAATGFVYPSLFEGFGLPILEAMACGVPVLCSNTPSLWEVAGDAALTVTLDQDDERANLDVLVGGLGRLIDDAALRRTLIRLGIERAATFSWQRTADQVISIYEWTLRRV